MLKKRVVFERLKWLLRDVNSCFHWICLCVVHSHKRSSVVLRTRERRISFLFSLPCRFVCSRLQVWEVKNEFTQKVYTHTHTLRNTLRVESWELEGSIECCKKSTGQTTMCVYLSGCSLCYIINQSNRFRPKHKHPHRKKKREMCLTQFEDFLPHWHHISPPPLFFPCGLSCLPLRSPHRLPQRFDIQTALLTPRWPPTHAQWYPRGRTGLSHPSGSSGDSPPWSGRERERGRTLPILPLSGKVAGLLH